MREIKFRAWDGKHSVMEAVTSIDFAGVDNHNPVGSVLAVKFDQMKPGYAWVNSDDCVLMQFTGLKDKNGVEIYESDYCMVGDVKVEIIFVDGCFGFDDPTNQGTLVFLPQFQLEVIGNKYEN